MSEVNNVNIANTFKSAFDSDTELVQYGRDSLGMFTLALYLRLEDLDDFAANALTEGSDDKKIDVCFIDEEHSMILIAQCYMADEWFHQAAPSNKASDLSTAVAWLFSPSEDLIPPHLLTKAREARRAVRERSITRFEILYIHNCLESENVRNELKTVSDAARDILSSYSLAGQEAITIKYREFGVTEIEELYRSRESEILVDDIIEIPITTYIREESDEWLGILASVPAQWVRGLHKTYGDRLFSANYRDYLGFSHRQANINLQITNTASSEPQNFWVYNNGITALTYKLDLDGVPKIRGISIINGAQTTGSLGVAKDSSTEQAKVLIRIVQCGSPELVDKIIRYNNTQNEIKPADRRSNDATQKRLRADFAKYGIDYVHRRNSARVSRNAITATAISPALCAFHGDIQTAYRKSREIFNDDNIYLRVFPDNLRIEHVFLVRALSIAIDNLKSELKNKMGQGTATRMQTQEYEVLKYSASKLFIFFTAGFIAEQILGRRITNLHDWKAERSVIAADNRSLINAWEEVLHAILPNLATLMGRRGVDPFYDVPRSAELSKSVAEELTSLVAALESTLQSQFAQLRDRTNA